MDVTGWSTTAAGSTTTARTAPAGATTHLAATWGWFALALVILLGLGTTPAGTLVFPETVFLSVLQPVSVPIHEGRGGFRDDPATVPTMRQQAPAEQEGHEQAGQGWELHAGHGDDIRGG